MSTRMLIDARHTEETRVAIVKGSRVEDFDYESATKRQIKGNIYLARITRVEPSLQACFVEYGGNRHGFLAFSEIHPDYYQIPAEDREELIKTEREEELAASEAELNSDESNGKKAKKSEKPKSEPSPDDGAASDSKSESVAENIESKPADEDDSQDDDVEDIAEDSAEAEQEEEIAAAESRRNMRALTRRYKIQEVIKRRQVMLIQVVKEERGNKGAALTTYISLAGRYCVLMPNSTHSGGISRKISNVADRKRLKSMMSSLNLPQSMGCIVRTAGMARTKTEVKRDLDYLLRLWNGIRDLTLKSVAPANVYEEGNLIKRSIRDLYSKDIDEILVEGNEGFTVAQNFITMLMPSHAKKVVHYKDGAIPLFNRYQVETQLEAMYNPNVQLKSGGYIVINPTEALISVDVNSGRATKEKNIEETAVKTNLEAAEELGRQLRLRDMAGLIVIDFIDMDDRGNNRAVERRLKDVLKSDRARIQIGRISSFGLLEMSRQRLRPNVLEASMMVCAHCDGSGVVRNVESAALQSLRALEDEGIRGRSAHLKVSLNRDVAIYMLNKKRADIYDLEKRYALEIEVHGRRDLGPSDMEVERENITPVKENISAEALMTQSIVMDPIDDAEEDSLNSQSTSRDEGTDSRPRTRRRRRRRGRGDDTNAESVNAESQTSNDTSSENVTVPANDVESSGEQEDKPKSRRRRGRRGGRRRKGADKSEVAVNGNTDGETPTVSQETTSSANSPEKSVEANKTDTAVETAGDEPKRPRRRRGGKKSEDAVAEVPAETPSDTKAVVKPADSDASADKQEEKPKSTRRPRRRKPADKDTEAEKPADDKADKSDAANKEVKAKPARRTRSTKTSDAEEKPVAVDSKEPEKAPVADKPKRGRPKKADPAKTVAAVAETTVTPTVAAKTAAADVKESPKEDKADVKSDQPSRSGWWNKTFG